MNKSLGIIETIGFTSAFRAADEMLKATYVEIAGVEKIGSGMVTVTVSGDLSSVKAAVEIGAEAARRDGDLIAAHVIPKPYQGTERVLSSVNNEQWRCDNENI